MKIKLAQLVNSDGALGRLIEERLPARLSFTLASVVRVITPRIQDYNEARLAILREYGTPNEAGDQYRFPDIEIAKKAWAEMKELEETEVELADIAPIRLDERMLEAIQITPQDVLALNWLLQL